MEGIEGGVEASSRGIAPMVAVMFESKKLGSNDTRKYVVYGCKFKAPSLEAQTLAGSVEETSLEISGQVIELQNGKQYSFIDTDVCDAKIADAWYADVQFLDATAGEVPEPTKSK